MQIHMWWDEIFSSFFFIITEFRLLRIHIGKEPVARQIRGKLRSRLPKSNFPVSFI